MAKFFKLVYFAIFIVSSVYAEDTNGANGEARHLVKNKLCQKLGICGGGGFGGHGYGGHGFGGSGFQGSYFGNEGFGHGGYPYPPINIGISQSQSSLSAGGDQGIPTMIWRVGRAPNIAFGYGSGFSSNIGGISQSSGIGASFQSGDATAYGGGIGSSDGNYARGIGYAQAAPFLPYALQSPIPAVYNNAFGSAISSAQNFGNFGSAISSSQSQNGFRSAISSAQNNDLGNFQSAISSAQNLRGFGSSVSSASSNGLGFGTAISAANNFGGDGSTFSLAQNHDLNNFGSAVSASQNIGGLRSTISQATQQQGRSFQHSGASSANGPGIQASQSHAINTGYY
ncbi:shematrin-like protein 3 [Melitaea cinxia]|uniref:shematrin-like protein 3 n=1 Tax=Melitaea cinxia TaxID=113334 RepID=UPI001E2702A1|nr:shematrin-like protein 3 [Melitaea cinxia]